MTHLWRIGVDDHAFLHERIACGHQPVFSFQLDRADTAGTDVIDALEITKVRNFDMCCFGGLQDGQAAIHRDPLIIYRDRYHFVVLPPLNTPKPKWSQRRHLPHSC